MKKKGNILIADSQFLATESLRSFLTESGYGVSVVTARSDLLESLKHTDVSLIITDYVLFDFKSINDLRELHEEHAQIPVLILSNSVNHMQIMEFNNAGIRNIALKTDDRPELLQAVSTAIKGRKHYSGSVLDVLLNKNDTVVAKGSLTRSEVEIVRQIAAGLTTKEIAAKKHVSFHTVMTHRKNIFRKLGVSNSSELVMLAVKTGLIETIEYYI